MQTRGSTNKSPIKLSTQRKINNTVICLRMGEIYTEKTPPSDFKVTTPEFPLLSQQPVTIKEITVPYTNLELNPYPNTQLDLFCSDNFCFWCTAPKYVTLSSVHPHDEDQEDTWSQNPTVHIHNNYFRRDELGQNFVFDHKLLEPTILKACATCVLFDGL